MVSSSIPPYLDPANWQQANTQPGGSSISTSSHFSLPTPPLAPGPTHGSGSSSIRPGSMADQARMANIPMPEAALKCPRCDSTNTKFCYYNNYNLNQPRYLCKACKRYWTKGGTRRNVPVGGGSRRIKRTKSSSKTSPATSTGPSGGGGGAPSGFMAPPSQLSEFNIHGDIGLQYGGISSPLMETNNFIPNSSFLPACGVEPWRFQTSSLNGLSRHGSWVSPTSSWIRTNQPTGTTLTGLEAFPLHGNDEARMKLSMPINKLKENDQELNLSRQILVIQGNENNNNSEFNTNWGSGNARTSSWTDLSGFSSSSTASNLL